MVLLGEPSQRFEGLQSEFIQLVLLAPVCLDLEQFSDNLSERCRSVGACDPLRKPAESFPDAPSFTPLG